MMPIIFVKRNFLSNNRMLIKHQTLGKTPAEAAGIKLEQLLVSSVEIAAELLRTQDNKVASNVF
jgi:hypothetical protein